MRLRALPFFLIANFQFNRGKPSSARQWLDKYFAREPEPDTMAIAQDAFLLIIDAQHARARARLNQCLTMASPDVSSIDQYLISFCEFWLAAYDTKFTNDEVKGLLKAAQNAPGSLKLKANFPLPRPETIDRIRDDGAAYPFRPGKNLLGDGDATVTFCK